MKLPISIFKSKKKDTPQVTPDVREIPTTFASGTIVANVDAPSFAPQQQSWIESRRVPGVANVTQQGIAYLQPLATEAESKNAIQYAAHPGPNAMSKKGYKKMKKAAKAATHASMKPPMPSLAAALNMKTPAQFAAKLPVPFEGAQIIGCSVNARGGSSHKVMGSFDIPLAQYETKREKRTFSRPVQYETVTIDGPCVLPGAKVEKAKIVHIPAPAPQLQAVPITIQRTVPVTVEQQQLVERKVVPEVMSKVAVEIPTVATTKVESVERKVVPEVMSKTVVAAPVVDMAKVESIPMATPSPAVSPVRSYMDLSIKPHSSSAAKETSAAPARGLRVSGGSRPALAVQAKPEYPKVAVNVAKTPDAGKVSVKPSIDVNASFKTPEHHDSAFMLGAASVMENVGDGFTAMGHGIASGAKNALHVTARAGHVLGHRIGRLAHAANKGISEMVKDVEEGAKGVAENTLLTGTSDNLVQADARNLAAVSAKPDSAAATKTENSLTVHMSRAPLAQPHSPSTLSVASSMSPSSMSGTPGLSISSAESETKSPTTVSASSPFRQGVGSPFRVELPAKSSPVGLKSPSPFLETAQGFTSDMKTPQISEASSPASIASTPRAYDAGQFISMSPAPPRLRGGLCGPSADVSATESGMTLNASSGFHIDADVQSDVHDAECLECPLAGGCDGDQHSNMASSAAPSPSAMSSAAPSTVSQVPSPLAPTPMMALNGAAATLGSSGLKTNLAVFSTPAASSVAEDTIPESIPAPHIEADEPATPIATPEAEPVAEVEAEGNVAGDAGADVEVDSGNFTITKDEVDRYNISDKPEVGHAKGASIPPTQEAVMKGYESSLKNVIAQKSELQRRKLEAAVAESNDAVAKERIVAMGKYVDHLEKKNKSMGPLFGCCGCQISE